MTQRKSRHTTRLQGYDYNTPGAYFLTICVYNRKCLLSRIVGTGVLDGPKIELLPYGKVAEKYIKQLDTFYSDLSVESYVIMPNHIHILLRVLEKPMKKPMSIGALGRDDGPSGRPVPTDALGRDDGPSGRPVPTVQNSVVSRFVATFKRFCNRDYGKNIWQPRSYDHIIRDQADFDKHLQYIYENPFGWTKDDLYVDENSKIPQA